MLWLLSRIPWCVEKISEMHAEMICIDIIDQILYSPSPRDLEFLGVCLRGWKGSIAYTFHKIQPTYNSRQSLGLALGH